MADVELVTIDALPEQAVAPAAGDFIVTRKSGAPAETRKLMWSNVWSFLTGGKVIGGNAAGDVLDTTSVQTATNKRFNNPKINSGATTAATSEDLDKIAALTTVKADFENIAGLDSNVQNQIDAVVSDVSDIETYIDGALTDTLQDLQNSIDQAPVHYGVQAGIGVGVTLYEITEATIKTALGLGAAVKLSHMVHVTFAEDAGSRCNVQDNGTAVKVYYQVTGGVTHLDKVAITVTAEKTYYFSIITTASV